MILKQGFMLVISGLAIGVFAAIALTRLLASQLFAMVYQPTAFTVSVTWQAPLFVVEAGAMRWLL